MQTVVNLEKINRKYPFLQYNKKEKAFIGYIYIDEDDKYKLRIEIEKFPDSFPRVFEIEERIPRKVDRHINNDNTLCFTTKPNEEILLKTLITSIEDFIEKILIPYLVNNSYYEINGEYMFGEYNHHPQISIYETYKDLLGINNHYHIANILKEVASGKKYRPNDICYCGSNKKIKKCGNHENAYRKLKKINSKRLLSDSINILELTKTVPNILYRQ